MIRTSVSSVSKIWQLSCNNRIPCRLLSSSSSSNRFMGSSSWSAFSTTSSSSRSSPTIWSTTATTLSTPIPQTSLVSVRSMSSSSSGKTTTMGQLVKELRTLSGAPIVDCKKALGETDNDIEQALDWLRKNGVAKASKKLSGRDAEEGLVACSVSSDGKSASIVKVSSETDFAGKSEAFVGLAIHVADATMTSNNTTTATTTTGPINSETVLGLEYNSKSVQLALEEAIVAIRENLSIASANKLTTSDDGVLISYVHGKADGKSNAGSAAAIVEIVTLDGSPMTSSTAENAIDAGKKLAMHVVASKPSYLDSKHVPEEILQSEKAVLEGQIADSGKPPEVIEKIINGRMNKFFSEVCLEEQEHMVEDGNPKVKKALKDQGLAVKSFVLKYI